MKIKEWIRSQELPETETTEELIEEAGSALDAACSHDICGETTFVGEDGQVYVGTVAFLLVPIHPDYLKEIEKEDGREYGRKELVQAPRFSPEVIRRTRKALKDAAAGNRECTMTDLDLACDILDEMTKSNE